MRTLRAAALALALGIAGSLALAGVLRAQSAQSGQGANGSRAMQDVRFMTLDPGHFHAALVQKDMYPNVSPRVDVFAPLGPDLLGHLARVAAFNQRAEKPTAWRLEVHTGPDYLERMLRERPGNVVIISGRNRGKIDRVAASVGAGLNALVDKPWILRSADLPRLESVLADADAKGLVAYDIMTERFEITTILQRELVNDRATFGEPVAGTPADPGVYMESVHYLMKVVSGAPNIRPAWFFDPAEQGEGLNDIGTHLVDLVQWTLFPDKAIDYRKDVRVLSAQRWPTVIPESDFKRVTGEAKFPESLAPHIHDGRLDYDCNTLVSYTTNGINTTLNVIWDWEAPQGSGDRHYAVYKGSVSRIEGRQTKADGYRPEVYVVPNRPEDKARVLAAVQAKLASLQGTWRGTAAEERSGEIHVVIPDKFRVGHEAHFAQVTSNFLKYLADRRTLPAWERPNMIAKYYITTTGTELSHQGPIKISTRRTPE